MSEKKELKKFKIGDKAKVIIRRRDVKEKDNGLGIVGIVTNINYKYDYDIESGIIRIESPLFIGSPFDNAWYFHHSDLELVTSNIQITSSLCPRCNEKLYDKQTEYGIIAKCQNCGWC